MVSGRRNLSRLSITSCRSSEDLRGVQYKHLDCPQRGPDLGAQRPSRPLIPGRPSVGAGGPRRLAPGGRPVPGPTPRVTAMVSPSSTVWSSGSRSTAVVTNSATVERFGVRQDAALLLCDGGADQADALRCDGVKDGLANRYGVVSFAAHGYDTVDSPGWMPAMKGQPRVPCGGSGTCSTRLATGGPGRG